MTASGAGSLLVRGGRVIDPASGLDQEADVLLRDGLVAAVGPALAADGAPVLDAGGLVVAPGFVDLHCHLREPGYEHKETIASGTLAAARGGFTTVCCMPNTSPPLDSRAALEWVAERSRQEGVVRVLPIGCVTQGRQGNALSEMAELAAGGAVAFSDDGSPVADAAVMRRALEYAGALGLPVADHPEEPALTAGGVMHEGWVSTRLGLRGVPAVAEEAAVARDIELAALTGGRLHLCHLSTAGSVAMVRAAKARGLPVTAEVTPHHLTLTHEAVLSPPGSAGEGPAYDTHAKVNPPLRTPEDVQACVAGLADGTLDAVATDHAPHALEDKLCEFDVAAFGISGFETAFGLLMSLVHASQLPLPTLVERLTAGPARAFGLERRLPGLGSLAPGAPADLVVLDPEAEWVVDPEAFASKGKNTPLAGVRLRGRVVATVVAGQVAYRYTARTAVEHA